MNAEQVDDLVDFAKELFETDDLTQIPDFYINLNYIEVAPVNGYVLLCKRHVYLFLEHMIK